MATTCTNCGPLLPHDVVDVTDYDRASGTVLEYRECGQCGSLARRA